MLYRKIEKDIANWIKSGDKALLLYGVRPGRRMSSESVCRKLAVTMLSSI